MVGNAILKGSETNSSCIDRSIFFNVWGEKLQCRENSEINVLKHTENRVVSQYCLNDYCQKLESKLSEIQVRELTLRGTEKKNLEAFFLLHQLRICLHFQLTYNSSQQLQGKCERSEPKSHSISRLTHSPLNHP